MKFLTKKEVAEILRVNERRVDQYIKRGELMATKPGGKVLVESKDLESFIEAGRIMATPGRFR